MKAESALRDRIRKALERRGALVRVTHGDGHSAGALDLDVVYRGRAVKLEVKTPENKKGMTPLQLVEQARREIIVYTRDLEPAIFAQPRCSWCTSPAANLALRSWLLNATARYKFRSPLGRKV